MECALNADRMKGGEGCVVGGCSKALCIVFGNKLDLPQRGSCKRMLGGLSSEDADCDRIGSPSSLSLSARIRLMVERAAAP